MDPLKDTNPKEKPQLPLEIILQIATITIDIALDAALAATGRSAARKRYAHIVRNLALALEPLFNHVLSEVSKKRELAMSKLRELNGKQDYLGWCLNPHWKGCEPYGEEYGKAMRIFDFNKCAGEGLQTLGTRRERLRDMD